MNKALPYLIGIIIIGLGITIFMGNYLPRSEPYSNYTDDSPFLGGIPTITTNECTNNDGEIVDVEKDALWCNKREDVIGEIANNILCCKKGSVITQEEALKKFE